MKQPLLALESFDQAESDVRKMLLHEFGGRTPEMASQRCQEDANKDQKRSIAMVEPLLSHSVFFTC